MVGEGGPWRRKPLSSVLLHADPSSNGHGSNNSHYHHEHPSDDNLTTSTSNDTLTPSSIQSHSLVRHLSVWDLVSLGVGGTVGSGIFVLTGQLAADYAGRSVIFSFAISGIAACLSGMCYAELAGRIPVAGSTYVYAYVCVGEAAAVIAAACLTLEYAIAGAAVARTWGDKILRLYVEQQQQQDDAVAATTSSWLQPGNVVNLPACTISVVCTALLLCGVQESKRVLNAVTAVKMMLVVGMICGGLYLTDTNMLSTTPLAPYGVAGVLRGATSSFFGYLGYDEICCVAGEAKSPARDLPRAILGTLLIVTLSYVLAATALTGMVPYTDLSPTAGFPDAFLQRHWTSAALVTAWGEVLTLPVVVLISLLAQPRLTYSMSVDGLLPSLFGRVDASGNLWHGTLVAGVVMTVLATLVPFTYMDDLISAGILVAFSLTNSCLLLVRCESLPAPSQSSRSSGATVSTWRLEHVLALYNALCFTTAVLWSHRQNLLQSIAATGSLLLTLATVVYMARKCPPTRHFGGSVLSAEGSTVGATTGSRNHSNGGTASSSLDSHYFSTPFVPYLPCLGMAVNWYLIAQLDLSGILLLCLYLGLTMLAYFVLGHRGRNGIDGVNGSTSGNYQTVQTTDAPPHQTTNETELTQLPTLS